jgi:hypothetical protein
LDDKLIEKKPWGGNDMISATILKRLSEYFAVPFMMVEYRLFQEG